MRLVMKARFLVISAVFVTAAIAGATPAFAASVSVTDLTGDGVTVGVGGRVAVFGIDLSGGGSLASVDVSFAQVGEDTDFAPSDLEASPLGVAIYRDSSKTGANQDVLDAGDLIKSDSFTWTDLDADVAVAAAIPADPEGLYTFFLVVQTSPTIGDGDDFTVGFPVGAFHTTPTPTVFLGASSGTVAADATAPVPTLTATPTVTTGNVVWTFSEPVTGVADDNVVIRVRGTPDDLLASVSYAPGSNRATIDPIGPLEIGVQYDTIVAPGGSTPITDEAGNPVEAVSRGFKLLPPTLTPGLLRGGDWLLNTGYDGIPDIGFTFGRSGDRPVTGDWDGDGVFTPGLVRGATWYLNDGFDGAPETVFTFGRSGDVPVVGDWDGDGVVTPGLVRGNVWYLNDDFDGAPEATFTFGRSTDRPVVGDWDDDGDTDPGVVRGATWYLSHGFDGTPERSFTYGRSTDRPMPGDWDGNGSWTPGIIRGSTWYLNDGFDGTPEVIFAYGRSSDLAVVGDWNGGV